MRRIEPIQRKNMKYTCPSCGEEMEFDLEAGLSICRNLSCNLFFHTPPTYMPTTAETMYGPMLAEGQRQLWRYWNRCQIKSYGFTPKLLHDFCVGYYPHGFWVKKNEDSMFGVMLFPMYDWSGKVINILAKHVGKDDKLDKTKALSIAWRKPFGVFNPEGFFYEEVHIYLNPTSCLSAIQRGERNVIGVYKTFNPPKFSPVEKFIIHSLKEFDTNEMEDILKNTGATVTKAT